MDVKADRNGRPTCQYYGGPDFVMVTEVMGKRDSYINVGLSKAQGASLGDG